MLQMLRLFYCLIGVYIIVKCFHDDVTNEHSFCLSQTKTLRHQKGNNTCVKTLFQLQNIKNVILLSMKKTQKMGIHSDLYSSKSKPSSPLRNK
jgi:hypothetical protein